MKPCSTDSASVSPDLGSVLAHNRPSWLYRVAPHLLSCTLAAFLVRRAHCALYYQYKWEFLGFWTGDSRFDVNCVGVEQC